MTSRGPPRVRPRATFPTRGRVTRFIAFDEWKSRFRFPPSRFLQKAIDGRSRRIDHHSPADLEPARLPERSVSRDDAPDAVSRCSRSRSASTKFATTAPSRAADSTNESVRRSELYICASYQSAPPVSPSESSRSGASFRHSSRESVRPGGRCLSARAPRFRSQLNEVVQEKREPQRGAAPRERALYVGTRNGSG